MRALRLGLVVLGAHAWKARNQVPSRLQRKVPLNPSSTDVWLYRYDEQHICSCRRVRGKGQSRGEHSMVVGSRSGLDEFFNRHEEVKELTRMLKGPGEFIVMLGPPACGKSALVRHLIEEAGKNDFNSLRIDLRAVDVGRKGEFQRALLYKLQTAETTFLDGLWKNVEGALEKLEVKVGGQVTVGADLESDNLSRNFGHILDVVADRIAVDYTRGGKRPLVLIIDEANELGRLEEVDRQAVQLFLRFCVRATKQEDKLHVIFTTSDPLFEQWLTQQQGISSMQFTVLVLGDLSEDDAFAYYLHLIEGLPDDENELFSTAKSDFVTHVYALTGGRLYFIRKYVVQVCARRRPISKALSFEPVATAASSIAREFLGPTCTGTNHTSHTYTGQDAIDVARRLTDSPTAYLSYHHLCRQYGRGVIDGMIMSNLFHLRPPSEFARDLQPVPVFDVVTATGQPALCAMTELLKDAVWQTEAV